MILQTRENVFVGADTAMSVIVENKFVRQNNDGKKLFEVGKDIVYCSGDMGYVPAIIENLKIEHGHVDVEDISRYLKKIELRKCPILDSPSIGVIICRVINGVSYVYILDAINNFDIITHTLNQSGIQIWAAGIYNKKCVKIATNEVKKLHGEAVNTYINTYKKMACQEIGGNLNVYYINSNGYEKIVDNYDLQDGYTPSCYGVFADTIVGHMIAGNNMFIGNKNGNVLISGDGIDITNGSLYVSNDDYSIELDPNHRLKNLGDYMHGITDMRNDFLFCIRDKNVPIDEENNDIIMGIDTNGNGYFNGRIQASGGKIANFDISEDKLSTNNVEFGDSNGIYFGENGLSIGNNFKVDRDGIGYFNGRIWANSGKIGNFNISNDKICTDNVEFNDLTGSYFGKDGLRIGNNFKVESNGNIDIKGNISTNGSLKMLFENPMLGSTQKEYVNVLIPETVGNNTEGFNQSLKIPVETTFEKDVLIKGYFIGNGGGYIVTSDRNLKHDIQELDKNKSSQFIYSLKPSKFKYNNGTSNRFHHGLIAQELKESIGEEDNAVYVEQKDGTKGIRYEELIADLIATIQTQNERISYLESKILSRL